MIKIHKIFENFLLPPQMSTGNSGIVKFEEEEDNMDQYKFLEDALEFGLEESEAANQAKQLGLKHRGFGRYSKDEDGPITHQTKDGELVPFTNPGTEQDIPRSGKLGGETEKEKAEKKHHVIKKKTGVTNIKRIESGKGKAVFSFKYNGKYGEMVFTKGEYRLMVKKHIRPSKIIEDRIEKALEKKTGMSLGSTEKKLLKRKEYMKAKKELGPIQRQTYRDIAKSE